MVQAAPARLAALVALLAGCGRSALIRADDPTYRRAIEHVKKTRRLVAATLAGDDDQAIARRDGVRGSQPHSAVMDVVGGRDRRRSRLHGERGLVRAPRSTMQPFVAISFHPHPHEHAASLVSAAHRWVARLEAMSFDVRCAELSITTGARHLTCVALDLVLVDGAQATTTNAHADPYVALSEAFREVRRQLLPAPTAGRGRATAACRPQQIARAARSGPSGRGLDHGSWPR